MDQHGTAGGAYSRMYGELRLSSPAAYLELPYRPIRLQRDYVLASEFAQYLLEYAQSFALDVERNRVTRIEAERSLYRVTTELDLKQALPRF